MLIEAVDSIIARLRELCPTAEGNVFDTGDLAGVREKDQFTPALHVVLYDYEPVDVVGSEGLWNEVYIVVAVVKNVGPGRNAEQRRKAGFLLRETLNALCGYKPESSAMELAVVKGPRPTFSNTHAYFPLAFISKPIT